MITLPVVPLPVVRAIAPWIVPECAAMTSILALVAVVGVGRNTKGLCELIAHVPLVQQTASSSSLYLLYNCLLLKTLSVVAITPTL